MPWNEVTLMKERMSLVLEVESEEASVAQLCREHGVSRKTAYKWLARFREEGVDGLRDRSRAPHSHPQAVDDGMRQVLVDVRRKHPTWGPRKVRAWVGKRHPQDTLPAASTVGDWFKTEGLVIARRKRARVPARPLPGNVPSAPNALWTADFKGQFRLGNGQYCYPLTIADYASRYVLCCQGVSAPRTELAAPLFDRLFREYGLPDAIRTDNGCPFCSVGAGGLSRLSIRWIKVGIRHEPIQPAHPEQNGAHERMHRTLKEEATRPPQATFRAQQNRFNHFLDVYNHERPHEALGMEVPAHFYHPSPRPYRRPPKDMAYPAGYLERRVRHNGEVKWVGQRVYLGQNLAGEIVGLKEADQDCWQIYFGPVLLGLLIQRRAQVQFKPRR